MSFRKAYLHLCSGMIFTLALQACQAADSDEEQGSMTHDILSNDCYAALPGHPTPQERLDWVSQVSIYAQEAEENYGVPAAAILAMTNVEGGFGWTRTAQYAKNPFGWKYYSASSSGNRSYFTLDCQPAEDPNNKYVAFHSIRDAVMFVSQKLANLDRYRSKTQSYTHSRTQGVHVVSAVNGWIDGIADAGYNYDPPTYKQTLRKMANNYLQPGWQFHNTYNTYRYSEDTTVTSRQKEATPASSTKSSDSAHGNVAFVKPAPHANVSGDVALHVQAPAATSVRFYSRPAAGGSWYLIKETVTEPFVASWATQSWVSDGTYQLRADAIKNGQVVSSSTITVQVKN